MTRVLITGSTGFLGKHCVDELASNKYTVIAHGRNKNRLDSFLKHNIERIQGCLDSLIYDIDGTKPIDAVIHIAALSSIWGSWNDFYQTNVRGTKNVIDTCIKYGIPRLVFVSSPSIYTKPLHQYNISEDEATLNSTSLNNYIKSKKMAEQLVIQAQDDFELETVIIRPRGLIGVGDTSIVPRLLKANETFGTPLFEEGTNMIDVTCVENVALTLRLAVESDLAPGNTYNITNGEPLTFKTLTDLFYDRMGIAPQYKDYNVKKMYMFASILESAYRFARIRTEPPITRYSVCTLGYSQTLDITRAITELGYRPRLNLDQGIVNYASHFRCNHS